MGFHVRIFKDRDGCKINLLPLLLGSELLGITGPRAPSATVFLTSWEPQKEREAGGGAAGGPGSQREAQGRTRAEQGLSGGGFPVSGPRWRRPAPPHLAERPRVGLWG